MACGEGVAVGAGVALADGDGATPVVVSDDGADGAPPPLAFSARTRMLYEVPGARPVIVALVPDEIGALHAPSFTEYSYPLMGVVPE